jgi:hypothetical protein
MTFIAFYPVGSFGESDLFVEKMFNAMPNKVHYWHNKVDRSYPLNQTPFVVVLLKKEGYCSDPDENKVILRSKIMTDEYVYFYYVPDFQDLSCNISFLDINSNYIDVIDNNRPLAGSKKEVDILADILEEYSELIGEYQYLKHNRYSNDFLKTQLMSWSLLAGVFALPSLERGKEYSNFKKSCAITFAIGVSATILVSAREAAINNKRQKRKNWIEEELWRKLEELKSDSSQQESSVLFPVNNK